MAWYADTFADFVVTPVRPAPPERIEKQKQSRGPVTDEPARRDARAS